ncbi:hypothetical protein [Zunongwangia sp.]|uniref:hypothetical protein n=1 Tax=Zunongwangia sp. TaxID=1965325 RepID=UPI003AA83F88
MKNIKIILLALLSISLFSCDDEENLPAINLKPSELDYTVELMPENQNTLILKNNDETVIPYWSYVDSEGSEIGHSNKDSLSVGLPFAGDYIVKFTAYTRGGAVHATPDTIKIASNDNEIFNDEKWQLLTNGAEGKTWELNMESPIGWAALGYPETSDDRWFPSYKGNEWVMENKDWGEMTFNLNGGYNVEVTQTALNSEEKTTKTATFNYNIEEHTITFNGGVELLYGGDYYSDVSNWTAVNVLSVSKNLLELSVVRDQDRAGQDKRQIVFRYTPKK